MATGIEVAGLALAILPLVIEAGKAYSKGMDSLLDVAVKIRFDALLEDVYDDFFFQITFLNEQIRHICGAVAANYSGSAGIPQSVEIFAKWQQEPALEKSFRQYFGSESRYEQFVTISRRLLQVLNFLIEDGSAGLTEPDQDERVMFKKLHQLATSRTNGTTTSSFSGRFRFARKKPKLEQYITRLEKWNDRLERLIKATKANSSGVASQSIPLETSAKYASLSSIGARDLVSKLHNTLCRHHDCCCTEDYHIKLCLAPIESCVTADSNVCIDFLFSHQAGWREGNVTVMPTPTIAQNPVNNKVEKVCDALNHQLPDFRINLLLEQINDQLQLRQLQPQPCKLKFFEPSLTMTMRELLSGSVYLNNKEKRELALIFAYSLLLYHDSEWLSDGWTKDDIVFFHKNEDEPDIEHPFLSARKIGNATTQGAARPLALHRNPTILTLGILLVEIFTAKPIENWRQEKDKKVLTANTDWFVAKRIKDSIDESPFKDAINACLGMDWVSQVKSAQLHEDHVRDGLLKHVIVPLEQELQWLAVNKIPR